MPYNLQSTWEQKLVLQKKLYNDKPYVYKLIGIILENCYQNEKPILFQDFYKKIIILIDIFFLKGIMSN